MHPPANSVAFVRNTWMLDALNARWLMPGVRRVLRSVLSSGAAKVNDYADSLHVLRHRGAHVLLR